MNSAKCRPARYFGIPTPDLTPLPIGGVARIPRMPGKPGKEIVVALTGPLVNILIAALIFGWAGVSVDLATARFVTERENSLAAELATVNVGLALFNLIPAFPMDGGRVV